MHVIDPIKEAVILLIEDDENDIAIFKRMLKKCKIANPLKVARDGAEALDYLHRRGPFADAERPSLLLLDLNMPRVSGREVLRDIKADPELRRIPVVVMTSSEAEEDIVRTYDLGANCYVRKPMDLREFEKIVATLHNFWFTIVRLSPQ